MLLLRGDHASRVFLEHDRAIANEFQQLFVEIEAGTFCNECGAILEKEQIEQHKKDRTLKSHTILTKKICVRKFYHCEAHPENDSFDKGQCCGKDMPEKLSKTLVLWRCEGCSQVSSETDKCQDPACPKKKIRTECAGEPMFPHTNEKLWREKKKKEEKK